jgi:DNA-binding NarL/FixJ family response regulator
MAVRVLIVDDVSDVRQDLRTALSLTGEIVVVGEAADGAEALRQVEVLQPQVALMDLEMPVMDGFEATRQIKSRFPACRVATLTVHDYPEARQKAGEAGADAFIVKGMPVETLVRWILGQKGNGQNVAGIEIETSNRGVEAES